MKVLILAEPQHLEKILMSVSSLGVAFFGEPPEIDIHPVNNEEYFTVISDVSDIEELTEYSRENKSLESTKLFIYFHGAFLDAKNEELFKNLETSLKQAKNWNVLKEVNELKIKLNILFQKTVLNSYPNFLQLELTDVCNAECIMCSHLYQKNIDVGFLNDEGLDAVEPVLPYVRVAILHGNGEPFLHPGLIDILEKYSGYNIYVSTSTNLSVFNERIAGYVNKCFSDIRVSCDGCTKEIYEQIRRNLSFNNLTSNMEMLRTSCPDIKKMLMVVIMRQNIHQLDGFIEFAEKYGFSQVVFSNMMTSIALGNKEDDPLLFKSIVKGKLMRAVELGKELGVSIIYPDCFDDETEQSDEYIEPVFRSNEEIEKQRKSIMDTYHLKRAPLEKMENCNWSVDSISCDGICDWCMERAYIDLQGNMFVCCINNRYVLGNIIESGFESVWNGSQMQEIRRSFFEGKLPDFCEGCHFILNKTLPHLRWVDKNNRFFDRRSISEVYWEHNEK